MSSVVTSAEVEIKPDENKPLKRHEESNDAMSSKKEKLDSNHGNTANDQVNDQAVDEDTAEGVFGTYPLAEEVESKKPDSWVKKFKHAVLLSYSGSGYYGLQRITGSNALPSIEEDFLKGLLQSNVIDEEEYKNPGRLLHFQRAARTDKGVSAAKQVLSMKLPKERIIITISRVKRTRTMPARAGTL